jgi:asparagine synthase (glutamine-hydrolysing)
MCGFAGALSFDPSLDPPGSLLADLAEGFDRDLAHRGPDGSGRLTFDRTQHDVAGVLVHRRLAVLDPLPRSDQPMQTRDGRLALVFNGEIFNYRQLRDQFAGRHWTTRGDTEALLAAVEEHGPACCEHLDGMYALAALDRRDLQGPTLLLARDPAGQKPLFVATVADPDRGGVGAVLFASELRPLRRAAAKLKGIWPIDLRVDSGALRDYLTWGYVPGTATIHRGIHRLAPGHVASLSSQGISRRRHFDPAGRYAFEGPDRWRSAVGMTRELVGQAVAKRLVSDVPIGCLLSGGIDSSIVALHMADRVERVATFAIGFDDDKRFDESAAARRVATFLGTEHHELRLSLDAIDLEADLSKLVMAFGEPFADSSAIPTRIVSEFARRHVKVALGGDGGDEIFGGYDRYRALRLGSRLAGVGRLLARPARGLSGLWAGHPRGRLARGLRFAASLDQPAASRYAQYVRLMSPGSVLWLTHGPSARGWRAEGRVAGDWFEAHRLGRGLVATAASIDRATYLPGDLLVKLDRCSMLHALEVRSPFLDRGLLYLAGSLDDGELVAAGKGKRLLRAAFAHALPDEVFSRPKAGFGVPLATWFRGRLGDLYRDTVLARDSFVRTRLSPSAATTILDQHLTGRRDHAAKLYALLMLELWWRDAAADVG